MPDFHGYGVYIWPAYGAAFIILAGVAVWSLGRHRHLKRRERELQNEKEC